MGGELFEWGLGFWNGCSSVPLPRFEDVTRDDVNGSISRAVNVVPYCPCSYQTKKFQSDSKNARTPPRGGKS